MDELTLSRSEICRIDKEMARLFEERMQVCGRIAAYKKEHGLSVRDPAREAELINRNRSLISSAEIESYYVQFLRQTIDLSCRYQHRLMEGLRVCFCGLEGAFAHIAAKNMFPDAELIAFPDFTDAYQAVERGECDCAVLPLENSSAGEVGTVMDLLFSGSLFINQVLDLPIVHHLIANEGSVMDEIKTVVSHPQALAQCSEYIRRHGFRTETYPNTAMAVQHIKQRNDPTVAAIASGDAAELFGMKILDRAIHDNKTNSTRFACFSRAQNRPVSIGKRTDEHFILVFTVQNEAGALAQTLNIIGAHGFNLRSLRSRPMKDLPWSYYFYMEADGNINTENGRDMLRELSVICAKLRLVGTYYAGNLIEE